MHTIEFYLVYRNYEILICATTRMNPEDIMQSENPDTKGKELYYSTFMRNLE